jgi:hypothetical protein
LVRKGVFIQKLSLFFYYFYPHIFFFL